MVWYQDSNSTLYHGDSLQVLRTLPDCSVQCCVTSPPYWALRDYGVDGQLGAEATPGEYVQRLVDLFREVRRVLRDDGTLFLNLGDTYSVGRGASHGFDPKDSKNGRRKFVCRPNDRPLPGLKQKDLVGIPWMTAFALREDGWYLRSEIIWAKRSPMPESVFDRPTKAHEQIFLLSKSRKYYWDYVGGQEDAVGNHHGQKHHKQKTFFNGEGDRHLPRAGGLTNVDAVKSRNMRSVWSISSYPLKSAHFAAYPPELVRRCLSAGVSSNGCCASCGAPRERITEKKRVPTRSGAASKVNRASQHESSPYEEHSGMVVGNRDPQRHCTEAITTGWKPGCNCKFMKLKPDAPAEVIAELKSLGLINDDL